MPTHPPARRPSVVAPSRRARLLGAFALLACLAWAPLEDDDTTARDAARKLLDRRRFAEAIEAYEQIAESHPEDAVAWFDLAQAHHIAGDYANAHEIAARGASFPEIRGPSLYNMACASALLGQVDAAADELAQALAAGFVDYDLIASDADLSALREAGRLPLPPEREYETLRHGGVKIPYVVLLPEDHDPKRSYPAAVVFAPGGMGVHSTDFTLDTLWADAEARAGWILVCAAQPSNGWINHPSHHALNALMKEVRATHGVERNRFHFIGLGSGARPASIYAGMSRSYVLDLTVVDNLPFASWGDDEVRELAEDSLPVAMLVSTRWHEEGRRLRDLLHEADGEVRLELDQEETPLLTRLSARTLLASLAPEESTKTVRR